MRRTLPAPRKRATKKKPTTSFDFYLRFQMITEEEYEALLTGNATLDTKKNRLMHLNMDHGLNGEYIPIYMGRAEQIRVNQILGRDPYDLP